MPDKKFDETLMYSFWEREKMLTYNLSKGDKPVYLQIYSCIKDDILKGVLRPGDKLPSKRAFATNHGVSTITIQNAYDHC